MVKYMNMKKIAIIALLLLIVDIALVGIIWQSYYQKIGLQTNIESNKLGEVQLFYADTKEGFTEETSIRFPISKEDTKTLIGTDLRYKSTKYIRIDFTENTKTKNIITDFNYYRFENRQNAMSTLENNILANDCTYQYKGDSLEVQTTGRDPYIVIEIDQKFAEDVMDGNTRTLLFLMIGTCVGVDVLLLFSFFNLRKNRFVLDLYENRKLIWNLSLNDFKTKYAGSFFGILWAFVQPVVTIVLYWFVFQVGFRSGDVGDFPFVLWLITGLVPWFFFQDAISAGTNCLIEYSYLVKKMVFQIKILPLVKVISALFVHLFFIAFTFIAFAFNGYLPTFYAIQIVYYVFCAIVLVTGLTFITSSIVVFFKDLGQIVQIVLQIGMWMTPIMWNIEMIPSNFVWLIQLNPMYYIVEGFRDSLINHVWFWNKIDLTLNFWLITIFLFALGAYLFKKLKVHFADVL